MPHDPEKRIRDPATALVFSRSGPDFDPGLGFETRTDFSLFHANLAYGWIPGPKSRLFSHVVRYAGGAYLRNSDQRVESAWSGVLWMFKTKSGFSGYISPYWMFENLSGPFAISGKAGVPASRYQYGSFAAEFSTPSVRALNLALKLDAGGFYDGHRFSSSAIPTWNASSTLRIEAAYSFDRVVFPGRGQIYIAHIARLRALCALSVKLSVSAFIQYGSDSGKVTGNFRVRYNPRKGVDLYVVYNKARTISGALFDPADPPLQGRALFLKLGYPF